MGKMLIIGNSHLAGFYRALESDQILLEQYETTIVQANFLKPAGLDYNTSSGFQKFHLSFPDGLEKTIDISGEGSIDHLVLVGLDLFGDGIIRCHGNLVGESKCRFPKVYEFSKWQSSANSESISLACLEYLYYSNICKMLESVRLAKANGVFKRITWVYAPDVTERCARAIFGDAFVETGVYSVFKSVYQKVFRKVCCEMNLQEEIFVSHSIELLSESGFSKSEYADHTKSDSDNHVVKEFFFNAVRELSSRAGQSC